MPKLIMMNNFKDFEFIANKLSELELRIMALEEFVKDDSNRKKEVQGKQRVEDPKRRKAQ